MIIIRMKHLASSDEQRNILVVRFLHIDHMVNGLDPPIAKLSLRMGRVASSLYFQAKESRVVVKSTGRNWTLLDKQTRFRAQMSTFDIWLESHI